MRKYIALLLALLLVILCACGNTNTAETNNTENLDNTADTAAQDMPAAPVQDEKEDEADAAPPDEPEVFRNPLTGEITETDISRKRPIAIMLNNISTAMPMYGNSAADIIFEMNTEGNITRLLGVYQNITPDIGKIGSIRSARTYYVYWVTGFDAVYVSASGSNTGRKLIKDLKVSWLNVIGNYSKLAYRDKDRKKAGYAFEHTLFTTGERFSEGYAALKISRKDHQKGYDCPLRFSDTAQTAEGTAAESITVKMNSTKKTIFDYDKSTGLYKITQYKKAFIDGNTNKQLAVRNVLVLYTKYSDEGTGTKRLKADMTGGKGKYICEGRMIDITWSLSDAKGLILKKADGSALELAVGKSFVCCADSSSGSVSVK